MHIAHLFLSGERDYTQWQDDILRRSGMAALHWHIRLTVLLVYQTIVNMELVC